MRYKVHTRFGSASFDESEKDKAVALYKCEGLSLRVCKDIFDEGIVVAGVPDLRLIDSKDWVKA